MAVAVANAMTSLGTLSKACHRSPRRSATLPFSLTAVGCQRSNSMGNNTIVKKNASTTPKAHIKAKILIGSRLEVARTKIPEAVVTVVSKIARPTFSYDLVSAA